MSWERFKRRRLTDEADWPKPTIAVVAKAKDAGPQLDAVVTKPKVEPEVSELDWVPEAEPATPSTLSTPSTPLDAEPKAEVVAELLAKVAERRAEPKIEIALKSELILPTTNHGLELVDQLNLKHAVIGNYGGKCVVLSWERWELNDKHLVPHFQSFGDFSNRYRNKFDQQQKENKIEHIPGGRYWLDSPRRHYYERVAFEPNGPPLLPGNRLNLWRGFAVEPRQGAWPLMFQHIYGVLGAGDPKAGEYMVRWLAWMFQRPSEPAEVALVLRGDEGTGKGMLGRTILDICGPYAMPISQQQELTGGFSGHFHQCIFLFVDEAFWAGKHDLEGRLKSILTEKTITIRPLYHQAMTIPNLLHIMMASNNDWVVPAGPDARRYQVFDVSRERMGDFEYFERLKAELDNGGREAMLFDLLKLDLEGWHPRQIYQTPALIEQRQLSLRGIDRAIEGWLQNGVLPGAWDNYPNRAFTHRLLDDVHKYDRYVNETQLVLRLKKLFDVQSCNNQAHRGWIFPPLPESRKRWERSHGGSWAWHNNLEQWSLPGSLLDLPASAIRKPK